MFKPYILKFLLIIIGSYIFAIIFMSVDQNGMNFQMLMILLLSLIAMFVLVFIFLVIISYRHLKLLYHIDCNHKFILRKPRNITKGILTSVNEVMFLKGFSYWKCTATAQINGQEKLFEDITNDKKNVKSFPERTAIEIYYSPTQPEICMFKFDYVRGT